MLEAYFLIMGANMIMEHLLFILFTTVHVKGGEDEDRIYEYEVEVAILELFKWVIGKTSECSIKMAEHKIDILEK